MRKIIFIVLGGLILLFCLNFGIYVPCLFRKVTGFYCPGCGITRMVIACFQFDFYQAFRYNPLVFILCLLFLLMKILRFQFSVKVREYASYFLLFVVVLYGILRNIEMFSYLQPTIIH